MSIDAVAVLRIANLPEPVTSLGTSYPVTHRGDATLINLMDRFDSADPDEHALSLRRIVGAALDAHDDSRGILFFPDVAYPRTANYDAIVRKMSSVGVWAPKVEADYIPARYRGVPRQSHDVLVGQMIGVMGRDAALQLDMVAAVQRMMLFAGPERLDAQEAYREKLEAIATAMGADFAASYEASLEASLQEDVDAQRATHEKWASQDLLGEDATDGLPACYAEAPENTHEALVGQMIKVMGREAIELDMTASIARIAVLEGRDDLNAAETYRAQLDTITRAMGEEFTARYEASLQESVDAVHAATKQALSD
jgi:hypothetical protein